MGILDFLRGGKQQAETKEPAARRSREVFDAARPSVDAGPVDEHPPTDEPQRTVPVSREPRPPQPSDAPHPPSGPRQASPAPAERAERGQPRVAVEIPDESSSVPFLDADEMGSTLEALFAKGETAGVSVVTESGADFDQAEIRDLFAQIAAEQTRPIVDLAVQLGHGSATKEWVEVCRPIMKTLIRSAEGMGLEEATRRMNDFDAALALAVEAQGRGIEPEAAEQILSCYDAMVKSLPAAFRVNEDEGRRDAIIIHALLKQIPEVGLVTFQRLFGAGLTSLGALMRARKEELAAATGISPHLCERICACVHEHRLEIEQDQGAASLEKRLEKLRQLVREIREKHESLERAAAEEWSDPALGKKKREYREARQSCALQIEVLLAEMGETDLADRLEKLPMGLRIEALETFAAVGAEVAANR